MVDTKRVLRVGLLSYGNELSRIARDFARKVEDCESVITPVVMSDCQFIYSRIQQCSGLITDILNAVCPVDTLSYNEGDVVLEWRVVNGEFVPVVPDKEDNNGSC